jgi:hypothetical protein
MGRVSCWCRAHHESDAGHRTDEQGVTGVGCRARSPCGGACHGQHVTAAPAVTAAGQRRLTLSVGEPHPAGLPLTRDARTLLAARSRTALKRRLTKPHERSTTEPPPCSEPAPGRAPHPSDPRSPFTKGSRSGCVAARTVSLRISCSASLAPASLAPRPSPESSTVCRGPARSQQPACRRGPNRGRATRQFGERRRRPR